MHNQIRAFVWGPGSYFLWNNKRIKVHRSLLIDRKSKGEIGKVVQVDKNGIDISCGEGIVRFTVLQAESKNRMLVPEFIKGFPIKVGEILT